MSRRHNPPRRAPLTPPALKQLWIKTRPHDASDGEAPHTLQTSLSPCKLVRSSENRVWNKVLKRLFILHWRLSLDLINNPVRSTHQLFMCPPCSSSVSLEITFRVGTMEAIHCRLYGKKCSYISVNNAAPELLLIIRRIVIKNSAPLHRCCFSWGVTSHELGLQEKNLRSDFKHIYMTWRKTLEVLQRCF